MNFINNYITYINNFLSKDFPDIKFKSFDIDKEKNYLYSEQESPLHNSVDFFCTKVSFKLFITFSYTFNYGFIHTIKIIFINFTS